MESEESRVNTTAKMSYLCYFWDRIFKARREVFNGTNGFVEGTVSLPVSASTSTADDEDHITFVENDIVRNAIIYEPGPYMAVLCGSPACPFWIKFMISTKSHSAGVFSSFGAHWLQTKKTKENMYTAVTVFLI